MSRDDTKFIAALLITAALAVLVVLGQYRGRPATGGGRLVDMEHIMQKVDEGRLSLHPAEFYQEVRPER